MTTIVATLSTATTRSDTAQSSAGLQRDFAALFTGHPVDADAPTTARSRSTALAVTVEKSGHPPDADVAGVQDDSATRQRGAPGLENVVVPDAPLAPDVRRSGHAEETAELGQSESGSPLTPSHEVFSFTAGYAGHRASERAIPSARNADHGQAAVNGQPPSRVDAAQPQFAAEIKGPALYRHGKQIAHAPHSPRQDESPAQHPVSIIESPMLTGRTLPEGQWVAPAVASAAANRTVSEGVAPIALETNRPKQGRADGGVEPGMRLMPSGIADRTPMTPGTDPGAKQSLPERVAMLWIEQTGSLAAMPARDVTMPHTPAAHSRLAAEPFGFPLTAPDAPPVQGLAATSPITMSATTAMSNAAGETSPPDHASALEPILLGDHDPGASSSGVPAGDGTALALVPGLGGTGTVHGPTVLTLDPMRTAVIQIMAQQPEPGRGFELSLNPEELGRVRIALSTDDAGSVLVIQVERPETLDLVRRHAAQLEQDLRALGHERLSLQFEQSESGWQQQRTGGHASDRGGTIDGAIDERVETDSTLERPRAQGLAAEHLDIRL